MKKTLLGAVPAMYDSPTGGDVVIPVELSAGGGLYDTTGSGASSGGGVMPTDELPGGGPGMQVEPKERPEPLDEGTPNDDETKTNYLPWIIGGIVLFMLFRRK